MGGPSMTQPVLQVCLLGVVTVVRRGKTVTLPRSRKVRALLALLLLEPSPLSRARLCDLLWDGPNDPRGELRWCLSKIRGVLDDSVRKRVLTSGRELITLDLSDCLVDAIELDSVVKTGVSQVSAERLAPLGALPSGDLLDGLQLDGSPEFAGWLAGQRRRYKEMRIAVLRELVVRSAPGSDETFSRLEAWLQLAPFDARAHRVMLDALVTCGRLRDADAHLAATLHSFEREGVDATPVRAAWRSARAQTVASVSNHGPPAPRAVAIGPTAEAESSRRRASVAVMPFIDSTKDTAKYGAMADGLTDDIITRLAKLRVLFVIARGTVYALGARGVGAQEAGRMLNVQYVTSGAVRRQGERTSIVVELAETEGARIVWTDEFHGSAEDTFSMLDSIIDRIVATIAEAIETAECNHAILKPPSSLDAWEAYHRGLWHMYKFNGPDNREAERFFRSALQLDPTFARAYAGLSFTHFQNAFLDLTADHERQIELAFETANHSIDADGRDPGAHWAMGRALWLRDAQRESLAELERSVELSPNFALGHYTLGFVHSQKGDPKSAIDATNYSRELSPFDPLQFGMLASRALAHVRMGELEEAAHWAVEASARPNAHAHILAIAAECLALAGRLDEARKLVARIRARMPAYTVEDFLRAFRFDRDTNELFRHPARQIGFEGRAR